MEGEGSLPKKEPLFLSFAGDITLDLDGVTAWLPTGVILFSGVARGRENALGVFDSSPETIVFSIFKLDLLSRERGGLTALLGVPSFDLIVI